MESIEDQSNRRALDPNGRNGQTTDKHRKIIRLSILYRYRYIYIPLYISIKTGGESKARRSDYSGTKGHTKTDTLSTPLGARAIVRARVADTNDREESHLISSAVESRFGRHHSSSQLLFSSLSALSSSVVFLSTSFCAYTL